MIQAILLGFAMLLVLDGGLLWNNFGPWLKDPNLKETPSPGRFLRFGMSAFVVQIIIGGVLTIFFSDVDFENSPLIKWFGYNNVCIVFDYRPSLYLMPTCYSIVCCSLVKFCIEDTKRVMAAQVTKAVKIYGYVTNGLFAFSVAWFSTIFAIGPEEDMPGHTVPFFCLAIGFALVLIGQALEVSQVKRVPILWTAVIAFALLTICKAALTIKALTHEHVAPVIGKTVDAAWVVAAILAPWFMHTDTAHEGTFSPLPDVVPP